MNYAPDLDHRLPETAAILKTTTWNVHPAVLRVVLGGSRGLRGGYRPDSDIDLSLIIDPAMLPTDEPAREELLRAVIQTALDSWRGPVELDTAAVFGALEALTLFETRRDYDEALVTAYAPAITLYKLQKGFSGVVPSSILDYRKIYPLLTVWERAAPG